MNLTALVLLTLVVVICLILSILRYRHCLGAISYYRLIFILVFLVPTVSLGLYLWIGSPDVSDQPLAQRRQVPNLSLEQKQQIERRAQDLSQAIRTNNQNGLLWYKLAESLELLGRFDEASQAFARAYWLDRMIKEQSIKE